MRPVELELPLAEYEALHDVCTGGGKWAKVDRRNLEKLLVDNHRLVAELLRRGVTVSGAVEDKT